MIHYTMEYYAAIKRHGEYFYIQLQSNSQIITNEKTRKEWIICYCLYKKGEIHTYTERHTHIKF